MKFRVVLAWVLAIPMFLLLAMFSFLFPAVLVLLAGGAFLGREYFFLCASFLYLLFAHLLFFGSYHAYPALYQGRLEFIAIAFRPAKVAITLFLIYAASMGYLLHYFKILLGGV